MTPAELHELGRAHRERRADFYLIGAVTLLILSILCYLSQ